MGRRRVSRAARRELAAFALAYLTYFGVRAITDAAPWKAFANAAALFRLEVDLGIDWEGAVQAVVLRSQTLVDIANAVYIYGHWPVLIGSGVLLFRYRRPHYYRLRNVCVLTGLVGLVIFVLFPVAPPRLTDLPVIDTVTRDTEGYRQILPPGMVNQFAAMPSFHAGWNLLVGIVVFEGVPALAPARLCRGDAARDGSRGRGHREPLRDRRHRRRDDRPDLVRDRADVGDPPRAPEAQGRPWKTSA